MATKIRKKIVYAFRCSICSYHQGELEMDPIEFVQKRKADIFAIEKEIFESAKKLSKQPFQRLPRFLRRRAASHNTKRFPARFRNKDSEGKNEHGRKSLRIKRNSHQLETYSWHSKRCKMGMKFGKRIPLSNNEKTMKHCVKAATSNCFIHDMSYWTILSVDGNNSEKSSGYWSFNKHASNNFHISCLSDYSNFQLIHPSVNIQSDVISATHSCFLLIGPKSQEYVESIYNQHDDVHLFESKIFNSTLVIAPRHASFAVWKSLVQRGCRVGAYEELRKVCCEHKIPMFPFDIPTEAALEIVEKEVECDVAKLQETKPKSKYDYLYYKRLLENLRNYRQIPLGELNVVHFIVIGKGRPPVFSPIYNDENNFVGYLSSADFSELHGRICAIGCIQKGFDVGSKLTCKSHNDKTYSLEVTKVIL